jgi:murein DD-endopeptidase MepM/ murein hydrolase activator NlpD
LTRRELRALGAQHTMQTPGPLPEVLTDAAPASVPALAEQAPQRRARRRPQLDVPAVPAPRTPVQHIVLDASPAGAEPSPEELPAEAVSDDASTAPEAPQTHAPSTEAPASPDADENHDETVDLFVEAARALNFTGETPAVSAERPAPQPVRTAAGHHSARRGRPSAFRRVATVTASVSAFGVVGLLAVGMTTPFTAIAAAETTTAVGTSIAAGPAAQTDEQIQAFVAPAEVQNAQIERSSGYETATFAELAQVTGINTANAVYQNDPTADIQWPIVLGTSMSSAFGQRWGRLHEGIDFTPGEGAPVQAIADGTVRVATEAGGAYGVNVYIDHVVNGEMITSHYAHMQYGSLRVVTGQQVEVGDVLGLVGNTGRSYGAHLHFELRLPSGQAIDPMPWLREHAGTHFPEEEQSPADAVDETVAEATGE